MGIILMRPLTSGVFRRLMAEARATASQATGRVGRLLRNDVLSDRYVDVALVGVRGPRPRYAVCGAEQRDCRQTEIVRSTQ